MKINIRHLIDFEKVGTLLEGFNKSTGFVTAILDLQGNVLSKSGWRSICTEFHRVNPETSKKCTISDTTLGGKLADGVKYHSYKCLNGLVDVAVPIVIKGEHIANLYSGQFFFEEPDSAFFKKQAEKYGFDEGKYLAALKNVPVVSEEKVKTAMDFLLNMTQIISDITLQKLEQTELNETIIESEEKFKAVFESANVGKSITLPTGEINVNQAFCDMLGYTREELQNKKWQDLTPKDEIPLILEFINPLLTGEKDSARFEKRYICKDGTCIWADVSTSIQRDKNGKPFHFITTVIDITDHKQIEIKLKKQNDYIKLILDNFPIGIATNEIDSMKVTYMNKKFSEIYGWPEDDFPYVGNFFEKIFPDLKYRQQLQARIMADISSGDSERMNWDNLKITTKAGDQRIVYAHNIPLLSQNIMVSTVQDITERKHNEEKNRANTSLIRIAAEKAKLGGWNFDLKENRSYWSDEVAAIHEMPPGYAPLVEDGINFYAPEWRERIIKVFTNCAKDGIPFDEEMEIITSTGRRVWVRTMGEAVRDENEKIFKVQGAFQDISEKKMAEEKNREKDLQFRKLSANVPDLIFQFTRKTDGTYCVPIASEGIKNIFGCTPEDVVDDFTPISNVIYPDDTERVVAEIEKSAKQLTHFICEFRVQIPGRPIQWILSKSTPERLHDGSITWYGFNADITERKKAEENIRQLNEVLEQRVLERTAQLDAANKELEAFSYSVSHDLRAPLRHINGYVDLLNERFRVDLPEKAHHYLDTIADSSKQMGTLIDNLLQFSRTGRQEVRKVGMDMNVLVKEVLEKIKPENESRNITWKIQDLPMVYGDFALMNQVWFNLLDNAVKYTRNQQNAKIIIDYKEEGKYFVFFVRDNGVGFNMKYIHKLFGVFQRLHSQTEFEGTGIGLANVQRIINKHGGRVWAEAEEGKGATFFFSLPKIRKEII